MAHSSIHPPSVGVVIATHNRSELLRTRALSSVVEQTVRPQWLVVVDDSNLAPERENNRRTAKQLTVDGCEVLYFPNYRTQGASGAWNTGIDQLSRKVSSRESVFIAILDDDDKWEPDHLEICLRMAERAGLDMVASGIIRYDDNHQDGWQLGIPEHLNSDDFLVGNPGIQGSNLFLRLNVFLESGLFDEGLTSCTDRDLCIRLADLGCVKFGNTGRHTVHHFALSGHKRLSTPGTLEKSNGLEAFWGKYRSRMSQQQAAAFLERAERLFQWRPATTDEAASMHVQVEERTKPPKLDDSDQRTVALIPGIIVDNENVDQARLLLNDLLEQSFEPKVASVDVVLLENGPRPDDGTFPLHALVEEMRTKELRVYFIEIERQKEDAKEGLFGRQFNRPDGRTGIGRSRTMLQTYVYLFAKNRHGAVPWILDDDMRLDTLVQENGCLKRKQLPLVKDLLRAKDKGIDVILGEYTGAPPLPFASTIRVQVMDLHHNLEWMGRCSPDAFLPSRLDENIRRQVQRRDYYYDLSRNETDRLETPFWFLPERPGETVRDGLIRMCSGVSRILAGESLFRLLFLPQETDPLTSAEPSICRGGNTLVLDIDALRDVPNSIADSNGEQMRRSDMIWSAINHYVFGRKVVQMPITTYHDRSSAPAGQLDLKTLKADMQGYAAKSSLQDLFNSRREHRLSSEKEDLEFSDEEIEFAWGRFSKYVRERFAAFSLSFHRIRGLCQGLKRYVEQTESPWAWWHGDHQAREAIESLKQFIAVLEGQYHSSILEQFRQEVMSFTSDAVKGFLENLKVEVDAHRSACETPDGAEEYLQNQRVENAIQQTARLMETERCLRLLGCGSEGVALTDGEKVYKYFDYWKSRTSEEQRSFHRSLVGKWSETKCLYPILDLREQGCHAVIAYPYDESKPYTGGYGSCLVQLMWESKENGIVCRNMHPDNLRVTKTGLRLIDYGSDIWAYTDDEFLHMCRRAWLTWRYPDHPDLKLMMRRAIREFDLPELDGFDRFMEAVEGETLTEMLYQPIGEMVGNLNPDSVLDYGCGKGELPAILASKTISVLAYDPDESLKKHWERADELNSIIEFTSSRQEALESGPFDVVICSLVLCILEDDEYRTVLQDLRQSVKKDGRVLVAICNPFSTFGSNTPLQERHLPNGAKYEESFAWNKRVRKTGNCRRDIHRPYERLVQDFLNAGLSVERKIESETVDIENFEPASDFMVISLQSVK